MKPIQTEYRGYKFRSRLEARWAVMMNSYGINWRYEVEGFRITHYWNSDGLQSHEFMYLPDFWLPEKKLFVEVKGDPTIDDIARLCAAAIPHWGLPSSGDPSRCGNRLLIVGNLPAELCAPHGVMLSFWKGQVLWQVSSLQVPIQPAWDNVISDDSGSFDQAAAAYIVELLKDDWVIDSDRPEDLAAGRAGRHARFEHGETPA